MMRVKVMVKNNQKTIKVPVGIRMLIRRCCQAVLVMEQFPHDAEVSVSFVSNAEIRNLNRIYRKKDSVTDVLSFPLGVDGKYDISKETGCALLGDVVISLETAMRQADLYGHSLEREIGFLNLLGYDHETSPLEARKMREKEEQVLGELGISREETFVSEE